MSGWMIVVVALGCGGPREPSQPPVATSTPIPLDPPVPAAPPVDPPTDDRYAASQILVAWKGAVAAPATVTRDEAAAKTLADDVHARLVAGEDFATVAAANSDAPSGRRGGSIGVFLPGTMIPDVETAIAAVNIGQLTPVIRTPFGFVVLRRDAVVEARAAHVLAAFVGAERSQSPRTRDVALARITDALRRIDAGEDFGAVARELSDDPTAIAGGEIGIVAPGQMVPAFETALFALKPGQHSGVVETPYGFHVILRE
jgi:peptidyl-prolyl cis-trans isomerase SurA